MSSKFKSSDVNVNSESSKFLSINVASDEVPYPSSLMIDLGVIFFQQMIIAHLVVLSTMQQEVYLPSEKVIPILCLSIAILVMKV